ncbi:type II toxin-antitoxin system VapC family toxin [Paenibacillus mucilaginosus]|uniref:PIN domain-containing protein n=2 Tax=Paenibacillus mucilaginosus TaxID=61624 RepID=H6NL32_9BACL|nr:hypothetical protein [Paenibacillus mucilaginosus]AEI41180.1 hypothetical protein KNP414_02619 [Paenibacillus mucilaginosus KNP414]AFC29739.1 hypothetical protein PM3016_2865 [Paenibacillus mucilaginosus 3016]MCG7211392.1 hypothetical protein [Paenibacillus mucilaginosus]WDM30229.1 hypothetical protein KCX80_14230 [Paenibacillus mucilaginosus]WFA18411.1 hypothetical protein ERY13_14595 [Paenibacillus mucilaginosus]
MSVLDTDGLGQTVFLEQSALMAFMNPEDPYYLKARTLFYDMDDMDRRLATTNYVVFETHQWLRNHFDYSDAQIFLNTMDKAAQKGVLTIIPSSPELEQEAKRLIIDFPNYQFSLSEALTAVVMLSYQMKRIFTFNPNYSFLPKMDREIKVLPSMW